MELRTFVIVPAYNEEHAIGGVVTGLLHTGVDVVVIDDGSTDGTGEVASAAGAEVLRHVVNRGQGAALQTGLTHALRRGADFIVTFDSDGQHRVEDVARLVEPLRRGEADVALGSRFIGSAEDIPWRRRILLKCAVLFTRLTTRARLTDTHNGLRAFTREAAAQVDIRLDRMAHASELLDQIVGGRMRFVEVPVHVRYTTYSRSKGQSSFGALRVLLDYLIGKWLR